MRVAAIYDIHGNLPALEAVLLEIRRAGVDQVVVGGDVLPGPMPRETLERLLDLDIPVRFIQGNGDREVVAPTGSVPQRFRELMQWNAAQLSPEQVRLVGSWPATYQMHIPGIGEVLFCHATPRSDTEVFTRLTPDDVVLPLFAGLNISMAVCGHTHMQFERTIGEVRVVNAGSVGTPFAEPGAYWLTLGPSTVLRRTAYDLVNAAERIRSTGYPQAKDFAERNVLQPPSEAEMLRAFALADAPGSRTS